MIRIGLLGGPGVGKTSQVAHVFATLRQRGIVVEQVQEFAREAINRGLFPRTAWRQLAIYDEQRKREDSLPSAVQVMITDSPIILSYVYGLETAELPQDEYLLVELYHRFLVDLGRYDLLFLLEREKPYLVDGTRRQDEASARAIDGRIRWLLEAHQVRFHRLSGSVQERTSAVVDELQLLSLAG